MKIKFIIYKIKWRLVHLLFGKFLKYSKFKFFSQEGEDILIDRYFPTKYDGLYVDIGAHHPLRFSNTFYFYSKGWTGINIDAMPGSMDLFNLIRPKDINLEIGISDSEQVLTYFQFDEIAYNTFDKSQVEKYKTLNIQPKATAEIKTYSLESVLDKYLPENKKIDFLTMDIEGLELDVLNTNNWLKYSPGFIVIEDQNFDFLQIQSNPIYQFLHGKGYMLVSKCYNSVIYKHSDFQ